MKKLLFKVFLLLHITINCQNNIKEFKQVNSFAIEAPKEDGFPKAYFASGCFWCVEAIFESVYGVHEVISGYSGGFTKNPTYELSNTGRTGHAEAVEVYYDDKIVSYSTLLDVYFGSQNVSQINGQGPDIGSQYRSIIFYQNKLQRNLIYNKIKEIERSNKVSVAAEVHLFQKFWKAENYHQNYERLHPNDPYVRNVSIPRLKKFQKKFPHLLKINH